MPDAEPDSAKSPGMAGGHEAKKLVFVGTSERPIKALDSGWLPKKSGLPLATFRAAPSRIR